MNNQIISKSDAEILQSASKILKRLSKEYSVRLNDWRKSANASNNQKYRNAKRKYYYFVDICNKHNIGVQLCDESVVLVS